MSAKVRSVGQVFTITVYYLDAFNCRRRDRAHKKIKAIFYKVIQKRRESLKTEDDMLQTLLDVTYKYVILFGLHFIKVEGYRPDFGKVGLKRS